MANVNNKNMLVAFLVTTRCSFLPVEENKDMTQNIHSRSIHLFG